MPDEMYRPLRDTMPWEKRAGTPMPLFAAPSRLPHKTRVKGALIQKHQFWLAVLALPDAPIQNRRAKAARHPGNGGFGCRAGRLSAGTLCACLGSLKKLCAKIAFQGQWPLVSIRQNSARYFPLQQRPHGNRAGMHAFSPAMLCAQAYLSNFAHAGCPVVLQTGL